MPKVAETETRKKVTVKQTDKLFALFAGQGREEEVKGGGDDDCDDDGDHDDDNDDDQVMITREYRKFVKINNKKCRKMLTKQ